MAANESQSAAPPKPPVSVTVTDVPVGAVVELTLRTGAAWIGERPRRRRPIGRVEHRDLRRADDREIGRRDRRAQLSGARERRDTVGAVPPHDRSGREPAAIDGQRERRAADRCAAGESELMTGGPGSTVTAGLVARRVYP